MSAKCSGYKRTSTVYLQMIRHALIVFFNFHDVSKAVPRLKAHKNDDSTGLTSDHIINAGDECYTHIALLFTAIVVHGTVPDSFFI